MLASRYFEVLRLRVGTYLKLGLLVLGTPELRKNTMWPMRTGDSLVVGYVIRHFQFPLSTSDIHGSLTFRTRREI